MKKLSSFIAGVLTGALVFGGTAAYAAGVIAEKSQNRFIVNGEEMALDAYMIEGHNYFMLRDLGKLLDFGVAWDAENKCVVIDTSVSELQDIPKFASGNPKAGDIIACSDGYKYEIKDVSKYDNNMFAEGPLGPLPEPTCNWDLMPKAVIPAEEARHFTVQDKEYMFVRNITETKRMLYTLYNAIGENEETWKNGKPVLFASGKPKVTVSLTVTDETYSQSFWPWRSSEIVNLFNSCPPGHYETEAWDVYIDGKFVYTEYKIAVQ